MAWTVGWIVAVTTPRTPCTTQEAKRSASHRDERLEIRLRELHNRGGAGLECLHGGGSVRDAVFELRERTAWVCWICDQTATRLVNGLEVELLQNCCIHESDLGYVPDLDRGVEAAGEQQHIVRRVGHGEDCLPRARLGGPERVGLLNEAHRLAGWRPWVGLAWKATCRSRRVRVYKATGSLSTE